MVTDTLVYAIVYGGTALMMGPFFSAFVTPIYCFVRTYYYVFFKQDKLREEAERKGHVVQATLIRKWDDSYTPDASGGIQYKKTHEVGRYRYSVNGRNYRFVCKTDFSYEELPEELTLYWLKKPRKARTYGNIGFFELPHPILSWIGISFLCAIAVFVFGLITRWAE